HVIGAYDRHVVFRQNVIEAGLILDKVTNARNVARRPSHLPPYARDRAIASLPPDLGRQGEHGGFVESPASQVSLLPTQDGQPATPFGTVGVNATLGHDAHPFRAILAIDDLNGPVARAQPFRNEWQEHLVSVPGAAEECAGMAPAIHSRSGERNLID